MHNKDGTNIIRSVVMIAVAASVLITLAYATRTEQAPIAIDWDLDEIEQSMGPKAWETYRARTNSPLTHQKLKHQKFVANRVARLMFDNGFQSAELGELPESLREYLTSAFELWQVNSVFERPENSPLPLDARVSLNRASMGTLRLQISDASHTFDLVTEEF